MKAYGEIMVQIHYFLLWHWMVTGQLHAPAALTMVKLLLIPIMQEAWWAQRASLNAYGQEKNLLLLSEIECW
jgi:hypothetical protein